MAWSTERVWRARHAPDGCSSSGASIRREGNDDASRWKSSSAARKERRQFAEVITQKLDKLESVEKLVNELQTTITSMADVINSVFGMLTSQMQGQAMSYCYALGTTYYVEVPKIQYVDKIIEVPQFRLAKQVDNQTTKGTGRKCKVQQR